MWKVIVIYLDLCERCLPVVNLLGMLTPQQLEQYSEQLRGDYTPALTLHVRVGSAERCQNCRLSLPRPAVDGSDLLFALKPADSVPQSDSQH